MNLSQLLALARTRSRDNTAPFLWSDEEFTDFANAAVSEACIRARLLQTRVNLSVTSGVEDVIVPFSMVNPINILFVDQLGGTVSAGNFIPGWWYTILDPGTTVFTTLGAADSTAGTLFRATGAGSGTGTAILGRESWLTPASQREILEANSFSVTPSRPTHFARGLADNSIRLHPTPNLAGTLVATIARVPSAAEELSNLSDTPVIPVEFHRDLVPWMLVEAYSVVDADQGDAASQQRNEDRFEARFGKRISARAEMQGRKNVVGTDMRAIPFGGAAVAPDR